MPPKTKKKLSKGQSETKHEVDTKSMAKEILSLKTEIESQKQMFIQLLTTVETFSVNIEKKITDLENNVKEVALKQEEMETDHKIVTKEKLSSEVQELKNSCVFTKNIKDSLASLTIQSSPPKKHIHNAFLSTVLENETQKLEFQCDICSLLMKRAVKPPCCDGKACRSCAIREVTRSRACWFCGRRGLETESLIKDERLREGVQQYREKTENGNCNERKDDLESSNEFAAMETDEKLEGHKDKGLNKEPVDIKMEKTKDIQVDWNKFEEDE